MDIDYKKILEEKLAEINWTLRGCGCEHYHLADNNDNNSGIELFDDRLNLKGKTDNLSITFFLKDCVIEILSSDGLPDKSVCIRGKTDRSIFILCHEFED